MSFDFRLPDGWKWVTIEEVQAKQKRATITGPFGSSIGKRFFVEAGIPVIRGNNLSIGSIKFKDDGFVFITEEKAEELAGYKAYPEDIIVTAAGTLGQVGIIPKERKYEFYIISNKQMRIRFDKYLVDPEFAYYWLSSKPMIAYMQAVDTGSTIPLINLGILRKLRMPLPPLERQVDIREKLCSLDNKIELNRQINQILESMAETIFKSWFVDFEPVKAKIAAIEAGEDAGGVTRAAMRAISGKTDDELCQMQAEQPENYARLKINAELFPSAMQDSELGKVPEGWEIKQLDHIAHYQNGLALQNFRPKNDDEYLPVLKIAQLKKGFADGEEKASINIKPECIVENGDVVFSWSGSLMVDIWCGGKVALNQHLFKVTSKKYSKWFYYFWTKHHLSEFQRIAADKAVTMGHIKLEHLSAALCATPGSQILEKASKIIDCLVEKSIEVRLENVILQNLRDTLLPKLMSGEIRVNI